jgi:NADH-quinone oxidoreductase subunit C
MPGIVTVVERHRREEKPPEAEPALDEKGQALKGLLEEALKEFQPEFGSAVDLLTVKVKPEGLLSTCRLLKEDPRFSFDLLLCLGVVDYKDRFEGVYVLYSLERGHMLILKTEVPYENPRFPSVTSIWRGADWYEREGAELYGVVFDGHPDLKPLLLWEGFEGYPGRKSYPFYDYQEW